MIGFNARSSADYYLSTCQRDPAHKHQHAGPAEYELNAAAKGEPAGYWLPIGRNVLNLVEGDDVVPDDLRSLVNSLVNPWTGEQLGIRPGRYRSPAEIKAQLLADNPDVLPEELAAAGMETAVKSRHARTAYDTTFSLPKSISVWHASLERQGRAEEAGRIISGFKEAIKVTFEVMLRDHVFVRSGVAGPKVDGQTTQRNERVDNLITAVFIHHTSRDSEPQVHAHGMVLNRVMRDDGSWRALNALPIFQNKHGMDAVFMRVLENILTRDLGVHFAMRPDGKVREVVGVSPQVRDLFSSRTRALTAEAEQAVQELERRYGVQSVSDDATDRPPQEVKLSGLHKWLINQQAVIASRNPKPANPPTRAELLDKWESTITQTIREGFQGVLAAVDEVRRDAPEVATFDPVLVIEQALAHLDATKSTWTRSHLMFAISNRLPDHLAASKPAEVVELLEELTDAALMSAEVTSLAPPPPSELPDELKDPRTGRSVFDSPAGPRYATGAQLHREDSLIARLEHRGGRTVPKQDVAKLLAPYGLGDQQAAAATTILTSDRRVHLIDAAAGVGKSRLLGALAAVHEQQWDQPMVGFATAENAARVMRAEGVTRAFNISRFLEFHRRLEAGQVSDEERERYQVPAGATVVIDEASTVSAHHFQQLADVLDATGAGKIVIVGDTQQVDAVDQAGTFALLAEHGDPLPIDRVRRFENAWEREASAAIREGDVEAVHQYDVRERLHGGDLETMRAELVDRLVTDILDDREALAVTSTSAEAATISSMVHEQLVRAGRVDEYGVDLHDATQAGIGDVIQARQNDWSLDGGPVVNRETYRVIGTTDGGALQVQRIEEERDADGGLVFAEPRELPASYVAQHVELAYAGTVEAAQGRTVDAGHPLVDEMMGRSRAYPGLTRGRVENHAHIVLEKNPAAHRYPQLDPTAPEFAQTAAERLAVIVSTDDHERSAKATLAAEAGRQQNLGHLGPQWTALSVEGHTAGHTVLVREVLGADADRVLGEDAAHGVMRTLRAAEVGGHDARAVLTAARDAVLSFDTAHSPAAVLHDRIEDELAVRAPERDAARSYQARAPQGDDHTSRYARFVAEQMDRRVTELGMRTAVDAPRWATNRLGPVPDRETDSAGFFAWVGNIAPAAAYREQYGHSDDRVAIGAAPSHAEPERLWVWNRAADGLGFDPAERDLMTAARGELANRVQAWDREQVWMPPNVDDRLRIAHGARDEARRQQVDAKVRGEDDTMRQLVTSQQEAQVAKLEEVAAVRARAVDETRETRDAARAARDELDRRKELDRLDHRGDVPAEDRSGEWRADPEPQPQPVEPEPAVDEPTTAEPQVEPESSRDDDHERTMADLEQARAAAAILASRAAEQEQEAAQVAAPTIDRDEAIDR